MNRKLLSIPALAALFCLLASSLSGEMLQQRVPRGNNLGWGIICNWAGPMYTGSEGRNTIQFPAGSGNMIYTDAGLCGYALTRDTNGDGAPDDTIIPPDGSVGIVPLHASIFNYDEVMAIGASEPNLGILGDIPYDRVWTSLDAAELADWPAEGRLGRSADGDPMLHGAETMFVHYGDVATSYGYGPPAGVYSGYSFYFLNYGENNDMIYVNVLMQNVSEYLKFNASGSYSDLGKKFPDGYTFQGMMVFPYIRQVGFGAPRAGNSGWAYHPEKELIGWWSQDPTISGFNPQEPPMFGLKVLRAPEYNGETAEIMNVHTDLRAEFGVTGGDGLARSDLSVSNRYKGMKGIPVGFFEGQTNPFTDRPLDFYPGLLVPEDQRYSQWLWGDGASDGGVQGTLIAHWGELHDVAPRDTLSIDYVVFFAYPGVLPLVNPQFDIPNIDDPMMQDALAPLEDMSQVAVDVFAGGLVSPETPVAPPLTIVPGDRQVTITWSDVNLRTPDAFYSVLQENGWDPEGRYLEYDFEGYRLYRSFVGPNDSHSELIFESSLSENNLTFFYQDKIEDDIPYYRMTNGLKVWYALVAYDRNRNVSTGEWFSLPDPSSSKAWNRPGESGLYQVVPRSEASNFKVAGLDGSIGFVPAYGEAVAAETMELAGNGDGTLAQAPVYMAPTATFEFTPVLQERLASAKTITVNTLTDGWQDYHRWGMKYAKLFFQIEDGGQTGMLSAGVNIRYYGRYNSAELDLAPPMHAGGMDYAVSASFEHMSEGNFRSRLLANLDPGGYTGADIWIDSERSGDSRPVGFPPGIIGQFRAGRFTVSWQSGMSVEIVDQTRGQTIPFVEYPDEYGWGFVTLEAFGTRWTGKGQIWTDHADEVPKSERSAKMVNTIAADNTEEFGLWVNGAMWVFHGSDGVIGGMPPAGTVMTIDNCFGSWNDDQTVFTQYNDPPFPGDSWEINVKPSTTNPEDVDFSKIRVVPNPYMASSFLDNSPNQKRIEFVNLPAKCTIRIYSLGGNLVNVLNHIGSNRLGWGNYTDWDRLSLNEPNVYTGYDNHGGTEPWNLRNRYGQLVASGLYFYHVTDERGETHTGKFYVIN